MSMPVYILRIPGSEFTGYAAGVDFYQGRGSTSSIQTAFDLAQLKGCSITVLNPGGAENPVMIIKSEKGYFAEPQKEATRAEGAADPAPSAILSPESKKQEAERQAAAAAQDEAERNPDSEWSKKREEEIRQKTKRRKVHR